MNGKTFTFTELKISKSPKSDFFIRVGRIFVFGGLISAGVICISRLPSLRTALPIHNRQVEKSHPDCDSQVCKSDLSQDKTF